MELKIIEWNIEGAASLGWNDSSKTGKPYEISRDIVDKTIEQKADIIVLTEFVIAKGIEHLFCRLRGKGYIWFLKCESGENGILIAVKENMVDKKKLEDNVYNKKTVFSGDNGCNLLRVDLPLRNYPNSGLTVIGCRMKTDGENLTKKEQYDFERKCFDEVLIPMINTSEGLCIICGDFNNAYCRGTLSKRFNYNDYKIKNEPGYLAQLNYNLNIIKDKIEDLNFVMMDVQENGEPVFTHKGHFPEDHIFVRGFNKKTCLPIAADGLSDHDIIEAAVEM